MHVNKIRQLYTSWDKRYINREALDKNHGLQAIKLYPMKIYQDGFIFICI